MSRSVCVRGLGAACVLVLGSVLAPGAVALGAVVSATIVPGSLTQGVVKASLTGGAYASESANLGDFPLNTGTSGGRTFPISFENPDFNGNSFGGNANTMIAFGNGGGVTLHLTAPLVPAANAKSLGIFTAQAITGGSGTLFNGNMEAAILVSSDDVTWYTLGGAQVPVGDTSSPSSLNAPTMAYQFASTAQAWTYGAGTSAANLAVLPVADFTTPMPDDSVFNSGSSTNGQRLALVTDSTAATYAEMFGTSAGGNWFDVSHTPLGEINYVRLNGTVNDPASGGVRLDAVFGTTGSAAAVPEPTAAMAGGVLMCLGVGRRRARRK